MGAEIVKAVSRPIESAVHDCSQISSESDCESGCCRAHWKTVGADGDEEIEIEVNEDEPVVHCRVIRDDEGRVDSTPP